MATESVTAVLFTCDACGKTDLREPQDDFTPGYLFGAVDHFEMRVREVYACSGKCIRKAVQRRLDED